MPRSASKSAPERNGELVRVAAQLFVERGYDATSMQEIADRMGRTESSIHGLHHRARRDLRRELMRGECGPTTRSARAAPD